MIIGVWVIYFYGLSGLQAQTQVETERASQTSQRGERTLPVLLSDLIGGLPAENYEFEIHLSEAEVRELMQGMRHIVANQLFAIDLLLSATEDVTRSEARPEWLVSARRFFNDLIKTMILHTNEQLDPTPAERLKHILKPTENMVTDPAEIIRQTQIYLTLFRNFLHYIRIHTPHEICEELEAGLIPCINLFTLLFWVFQKPEVPDADRLTIPVNKVEDIQRLAARLDLKDRFFNGDFFTTALTEKPHFSTSQKREPREFLERFFWFVFFTDGHGRGANITICEGQHGAISVILNYDHATQDYPPPWDTVRDHQASLAVWLAKKFLERHAGYGIDFETRPHRSSTCFIVNAPITAAHETSLDALTEVGSLPPVLDTDTPLSPQVVRLIEQLEGLTPTGDWQATSTELHDLFQNTDTPPEGFNLRVLQQGLSELSPNGNGRWSMTAVREVVIRALRRPMP